VCLQLCDAKPQPALQQQPLNETLVAAWGLVPAHCKNRPKAKVTAPINTDEAGKLFGLQGQDVRQRLMQPQA
jgi:hypothetical protein